MKKKRDSQASYTSDMMESESDFRELETNMDIIDEYYYGVRIFPGQDPSQVCNDLIPTFLYNVTCEICAKLARTYSRMPPEELGKVRPIIPK